MFFIFERRPLVATVIDMSTFTVTLAGNFSEPSEQRKRQRKEEKKMPEAPRETRKKTGDPEARVVSCH